MWRTLGHNYLVLTKQPRRITRRDINSMTARDGFLYGVSITTQAEVWRAERVPVMADLLPFVSAEPLLGAFDLRPFLPLPWVIVGAQTGPGAKPPEEGWVREIIAACRETGTPVFCKGNLRRLPGMELLPQEWPQELREASDD
jgi:protein gp37